MSSVRQKRRERQRENDNKDINDWCNKWWVQSVEGWKLQDNENFEGDDEE